MDKIEKVEIGDVFYSKYFNSWCQVVGFAENDYFYFKRNEKDIPMKSQIKTDYLIEHNLVFRNRELYPDQSQKQPEGEIPIMKVEDENGSYWVADNHIEEYPTESEKQEEWREIKAGKINNVPIPETKKDNKKDNKRLYRAIEDILSDYHMEVFTDAFYITKIVDFISQLLSERTFTKEELAILHWWGCVIRRNKDIEMVKDEKLLHERLGKLLNSKE